MRLFLKECIVFFVFLCVVAQGHAAGAPPQRIISLGPTVTKSLYLLGAEDRLIANTVYCSSPPGAREKEKIGTATRMNVEKIFNLKPDLVLATSLTNPGAKEKLKNLGINVVTFPAPVDFSRMCEQFLELGKLIGKEKEAEKIVKEARDKAISLREKTEGLSKPKVLVQIGAHPLFVATERYFVNDYIEFAGGVNIAKGAKEGIYSREQVLVADPAVIIIATMGIAAEEEKEIWRKYAKLSAVKNDRIYIVETDKLTSPTPVSFVKTLEEMVSILHSGEMR